MRTGLAPFTLKRFAVLMLMAVAGLVLLPMIGFCVGTLGYYTEKYSRVTELDRPAPRPDRILPERQSEPHTCGLHSVNAIYRAYGVDPGRARLRFRLGVDKPATNFDPESLGTIHPDIIRVMGQDGFDTTLVYMNRSGATERLRAHLADGHPALALVRVNTLHWIVLAELDGDTLTVADSLAERPYREPFEAYAGERILSAILVRPSSP